MENNKHEFTEKTVYLKNGQAARFIKKIDEENFIVEPCMVFYDYEGNEDYDYGERAVVSEVFSKPPAEKIEKEYLEKIEAVKKKTEELYSITKEVHLAEHKLKEVEEITTDLQKMLFNRSELKKAESITVFTEDVIEPKTLSEKMRKELKLIIEVNFVNGQEKVFSYDFDSYYSGWDYNGRIDADYGLLLDISEEELLEITKERADKMRESGDLKDYRLKNTDDVYLSDSLIEAKNEVIRNDNLKQKESIKSDIESKKEELRNLEKLLR
jgi:hypothetical protein